MLNQDPSLSFDAAGHSGRWTVELDTWKSCHVYLRICAETLQTPSNLNATMRYLNCTPSLSTQSNDTNAPKSSTLGQTVSTTEKLAMHYYLGHSSRIQLRQALGPLPNRHTQALISNPLPRPFGRSKSVAFVTATLRGITLASIDLKLRMDSKIWWRRRSRHSKDVCVDSISMTFRRQKRRPNSRNDLESGQSHERSYCNRHNESRPPRQFQMQYAIQIFCSYTSNDVSMKQKRWRFNTYNMPLHLRHQLSKGTRHCRKWVN